MNGEALGVIEAVGMAAAIEAADTCVKSASVELIGYELTKGSGLVTIKITGNVGAVKAAIEAAKASAARVNKVYATLIIPRPAANLEGIIESDSTIGIKVEENEIQDDTKKNTKEVIQRVDGNERDIEQQENVSCSEKTSILQDEVETSSDNKLTLTNTENEESEEKKSNNDEGKDQSFQKNNSSLSEEESDEICNICHDPKCPRKKGQPRNLCINYKATRR